MAKVVFDATGQLRPGGTRDPAESDGIVSVEEETQYFAAAAANFKCNDNIMWEVYSVLDIGHLKSYDQRRRRPTATFSDHKRQSFSLHW